MPTVSARSGESAVRHVPRFRAGDAARDRGERARRASKRGGELRARADRVGEGEPRQAHLSSPGVGSQAHIAGEMLKSMAGVNMLHVLYKGMPPAMNDLLGGQVTFMFLSMSSKQVQAEKLRALGVASPKRLPTAPDLPTIAEQGLPGFEAVSWYALMASAGTPSDMIDKIAAGSAHALRDPTVRDRLLGLGANPVGNTPAELAAMLKREYAHWGDFIRRAGLLRPVVGSHLNLIEEPR